MQQTLPLFSCLGGLFVVIVLNIYGREIISCEIYWKNFISELRGLGLSIIFWFIPPFVVIMPFIKTTTFWCNQNLSTFKMYLTYMDSIVVWSWWKLLCNLTYLTGGLVWYVPYTNPRPWTKTLPERKALSVSREPWVPDVQTATERKTFNDLCNAFNEATGRTKYEPTLQVTPCKCVLQ